MIFLIILGIVILLFVILVVWKRRFLWICIKTSKRDFRGAAAFIKVEFGLRNARKKNLTVNKLFDQTANKFPKKICCYFENEEWTFRELQELTNRVANYFITQNFQRGDSIGIFMENRPEYIAMWLGLSKIGLVPALVNINLRLKSLEHSFNVASCKAVLYGAELEESVNELKMGEGFRLYKFGQNDNCDNSAVNVSKMLEGMSTDDVKVEPQIGFHDKLFYIYTSGTTGLPKAAVIKHSRYIMISLGTKRLHGITTDDILYAPLPLYHSAGNIVAIGHALLYGSSVVFRKKFSATNYWNDCIRHNVTVIQYIGEICRYLIAQPSKPEDKKHKVRLMIGNGLRPEIWTEFLTRFNIPQVREFYGSTEGNCSLASTDNTVGSVGFIPRWAFSIDVYPVILVKVHDETGEILRHPRTGLAIRAGINEPGELVGIINPGNPIKEFIGYTDEASQNKKLVRDICTKGDAAFRSGDSLVVDELGYFYFKDRQGDTFRWKGENVATAEVEGVISRSTVGPRPVAVYGVEIPGTDGRAGMASIVDPTESVDLVTLAVDLKNNLPTYARPLFIRLLKDIDLTGTYKIKKFDLQREGFDIRKTSDPIFYLDKGGNYESLDNNAFEDILSGKIRL